MRPALVFLLLLLLLGVVDGVLYRQAGIRRVDWLQALAPAAGVATGLGLTDLCLATEARYTRHPAVTDFLVPFMDHPGGLEHFPSGSFWAAPSSFQRGVRE